MRLITIFIISMLIALISPFSQSLAEEATTKSLVLKPVMIIRFNQPNVDFSKQLQTVVNKTLQKKADAAFDVIQYVPQQSTDGQFNSNLHSVLASIESNGVSGSQVQANVQTSPDVASDEVYIYVR